MKPKSGKHRTLANKVSIGPGLFFKVFFYQFVLYILPGGLNSYDEFKKVFANNKKLIEEFVLESNEVPVETLEGWVEKKAKKTNKQPKPSRGANQLNNWKVGETGAVSSISYRVSIFVIIPVFRQIR